MSQDAEDRMIGCALLDPGVMDVVGLYGRHFTFAQARLAWDTLAALRAEGKPLDPVLAVDRAPELDLSYLTRCLIETASADNAEHFADVLRRDMLTRDVRMAALEIGDAAVRGLEGDELLSEALRIVAGVRSDARQIGQSMDAALRERYRQHCEHQDAIAAGAPSRSGYPTGVSGLDDLLGGLTPGIATIVAGRPGMGKSALGMTMAAAQVRDGAGVHVFSLEDTWRTYADRFLSLVSHVPAEVLRSGRGLNLVEQRDLRDAASRAAPKCGRWLIDDRSGIDAAEIVRSVRRSARDNGTRVVIVDYVQLLKRQPRISQHEHLGQQLLTLATAAKQDDVSYVVLSQLNRGLESRDDKTPRLSDLRESGNLEEFSKCVIAIHRPVVYDAKADPSEAHLAVLKNNMGRLGRTLAHFDGPTISVS